MVPFESRRDAGFCFGYGRSRYGRSRRGPLEARPVGLAGRRDRFAPGATAATRLHARARQGVKD
ncbi:hypothetical protein FE789_19015 [Burkholderia pseudomallei]|nr:hypothetical protein EXY72_21935 [Burkholderia pseudomallei]QBP50854.1 hypothetical protein E2R28_21630 [Burkholderia pseudomallei]QBP70767.1 hypothetical protein E2R25_21665 [Burkholderia pseudomallei]QBR26290.1 hypothetical protein E3O37_21960 [Burkholderia pseudomallei]QCU29971.1 hypothetical protein FE789_19015 [Burkholderia pseudomallei]